MRDFPSTTFLRVRAVRVAGFRGSGFRRGWGGWGLPLAGLGLGLGYYGTLLLGSLRRFDGRSARSSRPAIPVNGGTVSSREPAVQR